MSKIIFILFSHGEVGREVVSLAVSDGMDYPISVWVDRPQNECLRMSEKDPGRFWHSVSATNASKNLAGRT